LGAEASGLLRNFRWYLRDPGPIELCSDLSEVLPLPPLENVRVCWPKRYSRPVDEWILELVRVELERLVAMALVPWSLRGHRACPSPRNPSTEPTT
jgi:hypothetical protein